MPFVISPVVARYAAALVAAVALAGCATKPSGPEQVVRERATQQWQARIAGDLDKSYGFTTPSYRGGTSLETFKKGFGSAVVVKSAEVATVVCETTDKCVVNAKVVAQPNLLLGRRAVPPFTTYIDETWLREDGQWWLFPTP
ncbi:hypothetical protein ACFPOE_23425 [Caenimonas terrae]|uniref:Nuclear transport factor 2 family protein n=1 Tax=Caenimonas terrae TaxID=696074 RepID=A0ABW0NMW0_9BURK